MYYKVLGKDSPSVDTVVLSSGWVAYTAFGSRSWRC
ncbi:Uncharacterised protein [Ewingella americana]|uniref:Uncharacterized protein n=1 Tax=Ewingella americana TaxID=41202 RepID=A0A377NDD4_9GAMM|nr:Uncharacterised protein [Ewingella americana]